MFRIKIQARVRQQIVTKQMATQQSRMTNDNLCVFVREAKSFWKNWLEKNRAIRFHSKVMSRQQKKETLEMPDSRWLRWYSFVNSIKHGVITRGPCWGIRARLLYLVLILWWQLGCSGFCLWVCSLGGMRKETLMYVKVTSSVRLCPNWPAILIRPVIDVNKGNLW